ncbi:hypothetical protein LCGC14_1370480 [marine sediment metagenome]|uniref:Uncharacterized protein n=1 Tax=marine sediment metagenome TaxID=412755 RepID=A0A0F9K5M9_9ZZZZ
MEDKKILVLKEVLDDLKKKRNTELKTEKQDLAHLMDGFTKMIEDYLAKFDEHELVIEMMKKYLFNKIETYLLQRNLEQYELIEISEVDDFLEQLSVIFKEKLGIDFKW